MPTLTRMIGMFDNRTSGLHIMPCVRRALLVALVCPVAAAAQAPSYTVSPSDTLRFREISTGRMTVQTPGGAMTIDTEHDAVIAVSRTRGDTTMAWYDALHIAATSPAGRQAPATTEALRRPFTLRLSPDGRATLLNAPAFPASFEGVSDLTHQFDDFFLPLPAVRLSIGVAWGDTATRVDSAGSTGRWSRTTRLGRYRVARDTIVGGRRAWVVAAEQDLRLESGGPLPGQPVIAVTALTGQDSGVFVFDVAAGRLLGRRRSGEMRGTLTMRPPTGEPIVMPQTLRYTNTIEPGRR